jgi:hypothetical protein
VFFLRYGLKYYLEALRLQRVNYIRMQKFGCDINVLEHVAITSLTDFSRWPSMSLK